VLPTGHACGLINRRPAPWNGAARVELLSHSRLIADTELHRDNAKLVVLPPPCRLDIQPIDFAHADELIERGLVDARAFLDGSGRERPPISMRMHRQGDRRKDRAASVTKDACECSGDISSR
jgi:NTE family protein